MQAHQYAPGCALTGTAVRLVRCWQQGRQQRDVPAYARRSCEADASAGQRAAADHQGRRALLLGAGLALVLPALSTQARDLQYGNWDGSSAAYGSCPIGEAGADCRRKALIGDKANLGSYGGGLARPEGLSALQGTAAEMSDEYSKATLDLSKRIEEWAVLDPYDPKRPKLVQALKKDGASWAAKYARGGSARKLSARKFYVAVDMLQGQLVANAMGVMPSSKLQTLLDDLSAARQLLAEAK